MPLFTLKTNQIINDHAAAGQLLSQLAAEILNKSESYVMVLVQDALYMCFAGSDEPAALVELKSLGLPAAQTADLAEKVCAAVKQLTGIPSERIYIEFSSPPRHLWGWNGKTFA